ncbi:PKD domain-containing protein [Saccharicrinis aurantiacus]|uniref:PKD domain-containing protein n=1 Tax=Saccharicrinis aurantiacus TaxID=1849719 RepID=UPI002493728E|nr:PKD domain-containing protein [Saccharicrinis aurantiacus]
MIKLYTHFTSLISLSIHSLKVCLILLFIVVVSSLSAQTMSTCGASSINGADILANASPAPISGHVNNGQWVSLSGLTSDNTSSNAANHNLSGFVAGNTYSVVWEHNGGGATQYSVDIVVTDEVTVRTWEPNSFDACTVPYKASVNYEFTGAVGFDITYQNPQGSHVGANMPAVATLPDNSNTDYLVSTSWLLTSVIDANGCEATNLPQSANFNLSGVPSLQTITWNKNCAPSNSTITLNSSEVGITYELRKDGTIYSPGGSWTGDGGSHSWTVNTPGLYEVYALNTCGGNDPLMTNGSDRIYSTPIAQTISIVEAGPHCNGNTYTVRLANSESDVTYTLYNPFGNAVTTVTGNGTTVSFASVVLTAGTYSVRANNVSCADVNMLNTVVVGTSPIKYNVSGGTLCEGSTLIVGLSNSTTNVNYTLMYDDGSSVISGQVLAGTNSSLSFNGVTNTGTYWVEAEDVSGSLPGCKSTMNGVASINALPDDLPLINQGVVCPSGEVKLGSTATPTDPSVSYTLLRDGNPVLTLSGNGGELNFGSQTTEGIYTVRASSGGCSQMMTGALQVLANPTPVALTTNKDKYCSSDATTGVILSLGPVESIVDYQLERFDGTNWISYGGIRKGNDGDVITWTDITEGAYRVVGSNAGGCSQLMSGTVIITVTNPPTANVIAQAPIRRCENVPGTFNIEVVLTGNPPYNFTLKDDKGATISTVSGHPSNNYTIIVNPSDAETTYSVENLSDAGLCSPVNGSSIATVYVDPVPTITFDPAIPMVCEGSTIDITANGAGAGGSYTWSDGLGSSQTITVGPNPPGKDYTVIASSVHGCTSNELVHVKVNTLPVVDFTTPGDIYVYCENNGIVQLTGTPTGGSFVGTGMFGDQFDPAAANIGSNYITYNFTSVEGCTNSITKEIVVNEVPVVRIDNLRPTYCSDAGTVTINGRPDGTTPGSVGNFEVIGSMLDKGTWWDSTDGTATLNVGAAIAALGAPLDLTFRYTYTDPRGCTAFVEETTTLLEPVNNNIYFTGLTATCEQDPAVTLVAYFRDTGLAIGEGTYTGPGISDIGNGTAEFTPADAGSGTHTITYDYTDANGCSGSYSESVTIGIPIDIPGLGTEYCSADNGQYLLEGSVNGNPPDHNDGTTFDVNYIGDGTGAPVVVTKNAGNGTYHFKPATLANTTGLGLGDYEVIYRYNASGCNNSTTTIVKIVESVDPTFLIGTETVPSTGQTNFCENSDPVILKPKATLPSTAGSSFTGNGVGGNYFVPNDASVVFKPNANTITHTILNIVNGLTCKTQSTRDVFVTPVNVAISGLSTSYCTNSGDQKISVSGADATDGSATFTATLNGSTTSFLTDNSDNTATIKPSVGAGIYEVTMEFTKTSDGCKTTVVELVEVFAANPVTFSGVADGDEICQSSAEITLRGDMPNGGIGNFVEDAPGISNTGIDDLGNTVIANDGVGIFTPSAMPLTPYTITYEYTNADGCITSAQKTIDVVGDPSTLYSVTGGGAYCDDATDKGVVVGLSGSNTGVTYELLLGGLSLTPKVLFDGNGTAFNFTKNQDGTGGDQLFDIEGYYTVSAVQNNCNALMTGSVLIEQYELVLQEESKTDITCIGADDGTVTLKTTGGSGAYEYSIDGGTTWQSSNVFSGLTDGTHQFSVKEVTNPPACEKINTLSVSIVEPSAIVVIEDATQNIKVGCTPCTAGLDCEGSATITITGGNPDFTTYPGVGYKIQWSTGGADLTETGMPVGQHSVIVTDGNSCSESINVEILSNDPILLIEEIIYHKDNFCNGAAEGVFVVRAQGGSGTFQFNLSDPALSPNTWVESNFGAIGSEYEVRNLNAALHNIWVRDKNPMYQRCIIQIPNPIEITEPAALALIEESQIGITCNAATDGSFIVRASGGSGDYNFTTDNPAIVPVPNWKPANNAIDGYELTGLGTGKYSVWVQDAKATTCTFATVDVQLADVDPLGLTLIEHTDVLCYSDNTGRIEVLAKGGSGNYVYSWSDGGGIISSVPFIENRTAGIYTLTITDTNPNSCSPFVQSFTITEPVDLPSVTNISIIDTDCAAQATGSISLKVVGGTSPYEIIWSNNVKNVEKIENLNPGTYSILVKDANGCIFENSSNPFVVKSLDNIILERAVSPTHNNCFGSSDGTLNVKVEGGSGNYEFRLDGPIIRDWTPTIPSGTDEFTFKNLPAGGYVLEVRDVNNNNCSYTLGTYTITEPSEITLSLLNSEDVDCFGSSTGSIEVEAKGGSGEYDYSLDNGATWLNAKLSGIHKFTDLSSGTYYIKVRDYQLLSCESNAIVTHQISQPEELKIKNIKVNPVSCFSANDGTITVTGQGGSGNYDYYCVETATWQSNNVFSLPRGTYTFIIQEQSLPGCASAKSDPVEMTSPLDYNTTAIATDVQCFGANDGIIEFDTKYSNGSGGVFQYSIDNELTWHDSPISNLAPGLFTVIVKDVNNGCKKTLTSDVRIIEPSELTYTEDFINDITCFGDADGEIKVTAKGGTGTIAYQWSGVSDANGGKTNHVTNLSAADYSVSITDDNGCFINPKPIFTVADVTDIVADFTPTHIAIGGQNTGSIVINTITGGPSTTYSVVWEDGSTGMSRTGLSAGVYSFTVTSGTCTKFYEITLIDESAPLDFNLTATDAECFSYNGNIEVSITSGNPNYDITWYKAGVQIGNDNTANIIYNIPVVAGNYEVTVKDNAGAELTKTVAVYEPKEFLAQINILTDIVCFGDQGSLSVTLSGKGWDFDNDANNYSVAWKDPDGLDFGAGTLAAEGVQTNLLKPGPYAVKVYYNSTPTCVQELRGELSDPKELGHTELVKPVTCNGGSDGSIAISPTGRPSGHGFIYSWQASYDGGASWGALSDVTSTITGKPAGLYIVTIQSASSACSYTSDPIEIKEPAAIAATISKSDIITCNGDDSGIIQIDNITGGAMPYKYYLNGVEKQLGPNVTNEIITGLDAQAYGVVIKDVNGCESSLYSGVITEPVPLQLNVTSATIDCDNANSGSLIFTIEGGRENNISGHQNYGVVVSPSGKADIVIGSVSNPSGGAITVNDPLLQSLEPNDYTIKVIDIESNATNKCVVEESVTLELIDVTATETNATCFGVNNGSISNVQVIGTSGNYTFTWSSTDGGTGFDSNNLNQSGLSIGTYTLSIKDLDRGNCVVDFDFVIDYDNTIEIEGTVTDVVCNGEKSGAITIHNIKDEGTNSIYSWSGPPSFVFVDPSQLNQAQLISGGYTLSVETTISTTSGTEQCKASEGFTVNEPGAITFTSYFEVTNCDPYQRTLKVDNVSGGSGAYDYKWVGPPFNPAVPVDPTSVLISEGGDYAITVKDKNLCEKSKLVSVPMEMSINPTVNGVSCNGGNTGSIVLNLSGGNTVNAFSFAWTGPDGYTSSNRNIDNLYAGDYTVIITDLNEADASASCSRTYKINIPEPSPIVVDPTIVNTSCFGMSDGQIEIEVSGGTAPYTYNWNPVVGANVSTDKNQYNLPADIYTVTVVDATACSTTANIEVKQDDEITLSTNVTETICAGTGGAIDLTVAGGSGSGFTYDWSSADGSGLVQGAQDQTNLTGGTYSVTVSDTGDGRSCTASISETLTHKISIINEYVTDVTCLGNNDGAISLDVIGGDGNYSYFWTVILGDDTRIVQGERNQTGLSEGTYQITITDGRVDASGTDCAITKQYVVVANNILDVTVAVSDSKMCYNEPNGQLEATVTGGSGTYNYTWNGVSGTNVLSNVAQGTYQLKVEDVVLGCSWVRSYEVKGPDAPLSIDNIDVIDVLCYGEATGEIKVLVSGGTKGANGDGYTYSWSGPSIATGSNPTGLVSSDDKTPDHYKLTVTDANGCDIESNEIYIHQPDAYLQISNPIITDVTVTGGNDGEILVDITGGTGTPDLEWYNSAGTKVGTTNPLEKLVADTYRLVATDQNGCSTELTNQKVVEPGEALDFKYVVHQISPCQNANNGEIHINRIYGGTPITDTKYRIQVNGPDVNVDEEATVKSLINLKAGDYLIKITDKNDVFVEETVTIINPDKLEITTKKISDVDCFTGTTGVIEGLVLGGTPDAADNYFVSIISDEGYSSSNATVKENTPFTFSNLPAGNYTISVRDHADSFDTKVPKRGYCEASDTKLITQPYATVELTAIGGVEEICDGEEFNMAINTINWDFTKGGFKVSIYDGFSTIEREVNETPYVVTVTPTTSRNYEITKLFDLSDAGCLKGDIVDSKVILQVNQLPQGSISGPNEVCEDGEVTLITTLSGMKPFDITWIDSNNGTSNTETIDAYKYTFTDKPAGNASYQILNITDANTCSNSGSGVVDVTVNDKPVANLSGSTSICIGETTPLVIDFSSGIAPYTTTYEVNGIEGTLVIPASALKGAQYTWNVRPTITSDYEITAIVDVKGCVMDVVTPITARVVVNQLPERIAEIKSTIDITGVCQGLQNVDYSVDPVQYATNYVWTPPVGVTILSGNGTTNILTNIERDFTGGYMQVYAENACGASIVSEKWITANLLPDAILVAPSGPTNLCEGEKGLVYSITPVANATAYEWDLPAGLLLNGDGTGTSILVDLDPNVPSTVGDIKVRPLNSCSTTEPWSPVLTVTVTALPIPDAGVDERICGTTYTLDAATPGTNEEGEWKIIKGSGQFVNNADKVLPNAAVYNLSQGENIFVWTLKSSVSGCERSDDVIINNDQLTVTAIVDQSPVCGGEATLIGTPLSSLVGADNGLWSFVSGDGVIVDASNDRTLVRNLNQGLNTLRWTVRKGACDSYAEVDVMNNNPSESIIYDATGAKVSIIDLPCKSNSTNLVGSTPLPEEKGYWRIESGQVNIGDLNSVDISITNIQKGDHILSWNILRGGCLSTSLVMIRNNALDVDAGIDNFTCDGTYNLEGTEPVADNAETGMWTSDSGASFVDASLYNTQVTNMAGGDNTFVWTLTRNGCSSEATVTIRNDKPQEAAIVGDVTEIEICGDSIILSAVPVLPDMGIGVWSVISGSGLIVDPLDPNTKVKGIGQGESIFRWTVALNSCQNYIDFKVINLMVDAYAGPDQSVCRAIAYLDATAPTVGIGEWNVVPGEGAASFHPNKLDPKAVADLAVGVNKLVWTVSNGTCVSRDTVVIAVNKPGPVNAGSDLSVPGDFAQLDAVAPDVGKGTWSVVEGAGDFSNPNIINPTVTGVRQGNNIYRWTVSYLGCSEYDEVVVTNGTIPPADAGADITTCDDYTKLSANDPAVGLGEWTVKTGSGYFDDIRDPKSNVLNLAQGDNVFVWTIYYTNGSSSDEVIVTSNKPSDVNAGIDDRVCSNEALLDGRQPGFSHEVATWSVLSGGGIFDDANDVKTTVRGLAPGQNIIKLEINNNDCIETDTVRVFNDTPSVADAGPDQTVCADSVEVRPISPQYGVGKWRVIKGQGTGKDGGEITGRWIYNLAPGENIFEWYVHVEGAQPNCESTDRVTIINNQPSVSYAGQDRTVCEDRVMLSGSAAIDGVGTWELLTGAGTIVDPSNNLTEVTGLGKGRNRFKWTIDNNGCTSESEVEISYDLIEAFAGFDMPPLCSDTVVLAANEPFPGTGSWSIIGGSGSAHFTNDNGDSDVNNPYATVRDLDRGPNKLVWTISYNNCVSTDEIIITNDMPSTAIAGDNVALCDNTVTLGASTPNIGDGVWTTQNGGGDFVDINSPTTQVNNLRFGDNIFRWTVTHNSCSSYSDVQVSYNKIQADITQKFVEICTDETILTGNNASPGNGEWTVLSGNSQAKFDDNTNPTTRVYDLARGTNRLQWKISHKGCDTFDEVEIINHNPSTSYAGATQELCVENTTLRATAPAVGTGTWSILSGMATISDVNSNTPSVTNLSKGENKFLWTITSANGMCSNRDEVSVYNNVPSIPYAGDDGEFCSPTVTLKAATPDYGDGLWSIIEGGGNFDDPTLPQATITNLQEGVNKFLWTISVRNNNGDIGCSESDEVTIINNTPTPANAGPDVEDCKDYALLDANSPSQGTGSWSVISGNAVFADASDPKTRVDGLTFGENVLQWKIENGNCTSVDEVIIFNQVPTQADAGVDKTTCDNYYPLNANEPLFGIGEWTVISGKGTFEDINDPASVVTGLGLGENKLKWTITYGGCSTEDVVIIESNKSTPYAGEDAISYESTYEMKASNPGSRSAEWSVVAGTGDFEDKTFYNTKVNNLTEGINTFKWTMNVNGCVTSDDVSIEYRVVPNASFKSSQTHGCVPLDVEFTNLSVGGYSFLWDFGQGDDVAGNNATTRNAKYTFTTPGTYTVTLTVQGPDGEDGIFTEELVIHELPKADFHYGPDIVYTPNGALDCRSLAIGAVKHFWDFGDGATSEEVNPRYKYPEIGVYSLSLYVESEFGCEHDTTLIDAVTVKKEGFVAFPTAFTPRSDGGNGSSSGGVQDNSVFKPVYKDVDRYKLQIFNRWGQLIYESTDIEEGWNGFFNNQLSPQAVYVWKASGVYNSGRSFNDAGSVLLVR